MKHYLLQLITSVDDPHGQAVIEWAILSGQLHLTYNLDADRALLRARFDGLSLQYQQDVQTPALAA